MKYFVRNKDGELAFESYAELLKAATGGLVEADDEVRREDEPTWRKAAAMPGLLHASGGGPALWKSPLFRWVALALVGAGFAIWAIHTGRTQHKPELYGVGLVVVFIVAGVLIKVTTDASRPKR